MIDSLKEKMTNNIILMLKRDEEIGKQNSFPFGDDENKARDCYRTGQLEIRKCIGAESLEENMVRSYSYKYIKEGLDESLINMEKSVNICDPNTINISSEIAKGLTLIDERIRVGLLHNVNKDEINRIKNKFSDLKSQFVNNCK